MQFPYISSAKTIKLCCVSLFAALYFVFAASASFAKVPFNGNPAQKSQTNSPAQSDSKQENIVVLNEKTKKYHRPNCRHADPKKCSHCSKTTRSEAIKKGSSPCKACHNQSVKKSVKN